MTNNAPAALIPTSFDAWLDASLTASEVSIPVTDPATIAKLAAILDAYSRAPAQLDPARVAGEAA